MGDAWYSEDGTYWHCTTADRTPAILEEGLRLGRTRRWNNALGAKLGSSKHIYLVSNFHEAVRWGAKMEYDFDKPVDLIKVSPSDDLEPDDCLEGQMARRSFFKTSVAIPARSILRVVRLTLDLKRAVVADIMGNVPEPDDENVPAVPGRR